MLRGSWGEGAFSPQEENLSLPAEQSRAAQRLAGSPLELPSVGDSELEVRIGCELLSCPFAVRLYLVWPALPHLSPLPGLAVHRAHPSQ